MKKVSQRTLFNEPRVCLKNVCYMQQKTYVMICSKILLFWTLEFPFFRGWFMFSLFRTREWSGNAYSPRSLLTPRHRAHGTLLTSRYIISLFIPSFNRFGIYYKSVMLIRIRSDPHLFGSVRIRIRTQRYKMKRKQISRKFLEFSS